MPILKSKIFIFAGALLAAILFYIINPFNVAEVAVRVLAVALFMIILWVTEAMPMAAVALFPLILFPLLNLGAIGTVSSSYANPVIFLFMGGFFLGIAIEKWNVHRRIALNIIKATGTSGNRIVLGFILSTGVISMWLSNTATSMMMFPIAMSVIAVMGDNHPNKAGFNNFSLSVMIAIALAANFGGIATLIGTPPNVAYAAFISEKYDYNIGFMEWFIVCAPVSILLLASLYLVTVKWLYPNHMKADVNTKTHIEEELKKLGAMSAAEKRTLTIFTITAVLWIMRGSINELGLPLDDNMIALIGGLSLFIIPNGKDGNALLGWEDTRKMAWGILLLFGGGIALAGGMERAGLISMLGDWFGSTAIEPLLLILLVTSVSLFVSELMSNVAQVIVFAPVISSLAEAMDLHPLYLGIPMTLAASCASMLPMGTPPNAIAFSSGYIKLKDMTRIGLVMNIIAILLITAASQLIDK